MSDLDILKALRNLVKDADNLLKDSKSTEELVEGIRFLRDDAVAIVNRWHEEADQQFNETAGDFPP